MNVLSFSIGLFAEADRSRLTRHHGVWIDVPACNKPPRATYGEQVAALADS